MTQKLEEPLKVQVTATLDKKLVEVIDSIRGRKSRSAWINECIERNLKSEHPDKLVVTKQ